jgi:hypothetical protein
MNLLSKIDHLIYNVTDLHEGIATIKALTGVSPVIAGRHQGKGTWNALMSLGPGIYFEVIAPDPEQQHIKDAIWREAIIQMPVNRLVKWCAKTQDAQALAQKAKEHQIDLGEVISGSRQKNDGSVLSWTSTDFRKSPSGILPFFIDWGDSEHPSGVLPGGCSLISLEALHPNAEKLKKDLQVLGLPLKVYPGNEIRLIARLNTPKGEVVLL